MGGKLLCMPSVIILLLVFLPELDLLERMWTKKEEKGEEFPDRIYTTLKLVDEASSPTFIQF